MGNTIENLAKHISTSLVPVDDVKGRMRKGYAADLVADIEKKLKEAPDKAYMIRCEEPLSPRHLANVLRQRIGKKYVLSSSETERAVWIQNKS